MDSLRGAWREAKNIAFGYSDVQAKLREATSVDRNGPSTGHLQELANFTHHPSLLREMVCIFDKRLNDHGKYWRHVYKTLVVLEFCIVFGSEAMVAYAKEAVHTIKTLKEFIRIDSKGRDKGILVREKSKNLVELLTNDGFLMQARLSGCIPNITRPKSAEPILVDPKLRKRVGDGCRSFEDLQDVDEAEAMRIALSESRSASLKYSSLELDQDSDSSEGESNQNPFDVPIPYLVENVFQPLAIEANPFEAFAVNNLFVAPIEPAVDVLQIEDVPSVSGFPMLEYNVNSYDKHLFNTDQQLPFIPAPSSQTFTAPNQFVAKPVGPHTTAPQFSNVESDMQKGTEAKMGLDVDPFAERNVFISEAQNSPNVNLQK